MGKTYTETSRTIPVVAEVDVLVAGAGPAGFGAALGAAREGAKTMLIEASNNVGGMATGGMMSHWCGGTDCPVLEELFERCRNSPLAPPAVEKKAANWATMHEVMKNEMLKMLEEAGVEVRLYTLVSAPIKENEILRGVIVESKSGREAILARQLIDATGDGDLAARAGVEFQFGREEDHACQPVTLMFRIGGVDHSRAIFPGSFETLVDVPAGEIQSLGRANLPHPAGHVLLYPAPLPNEVCVNMTNVTGIDATDAAALTNAELTCRKQLEKIIPFLRKYAPGYENCYLVTAADRVGVRETRHFKTEYTIVPEDIVEAKLFDDWIAVRNHFNFDIHSVKGPGLDENGAQKHFHSAGQYSIPFRACLPLGTDNLLLAGRCIGGTHKAHSNFRVMPICLNIGFGTGVAAAMAVRDGIVPRKLEIKKVQAELQKFGVRP